MAVEAQPSSIGDQAERLRRLMSKQPRAALTLAVTSGKGGVGKSNVAVNLAICLSAHSLRVTLVDVDMGLANADLLMNLQPRYSLGHVLSGTRTLEEVVVDGPGGIRFVPGANGIQEWANLSDFERQNLIHQFRRLDASTDIVVLDCGAGISRNVLCFGLAADHALVVTTPQPPALTDAYATIKSLHREKYAGQVGVIVNMAYSKSEATATYRRLAGVAQKFLNYPVANRGYILHDHSVELAVRERCPLVIRFPRSNASACIAAIASDLAQSAGRGRSGSFFQRVVSLFA